MKNANKDLFKSFNKKFKLRREFRTFSKSYQTPAKIWKTLGHRLKEMRYRHPIVGWNYYRDNPDVANASPTQLIKSAFKENIIRFKYYMKDVERTELYKGTLSRRYKTAKIKGPLLGVLRFPRLDQIDTFIKSVILKRMRGIEGMRFYQEIREDKCLTDWQKEAYLLAFAEAIERLRKEGIWGWGAPHRSSEELREIIFQAINYDPDKCKREHPELFGDGENDQDDLNE